MKILLTPLVSTFLIIASTLCFTSHASETNRFRGPDGSGNYTAPKLPNSWSEDDYLWSLELPGDGESSPMIWKDHLYLSSTDAGQPRPILMCLDPKTGQLIWQKKFESLDHKLHRNNTFASSTTAVDEHHVYFTWSDNAHFQLAALTHDGEEVWRRDLGALENRHGGGISPIVFEDKVIIQKDLRGPSAIYAINRMTGKTIWKVDRHWGDENQTTFATPLVYQPESGEPYLIFNSISSGMTAVNPENGQTLWELPDVFPQRPIMSPLQVGELVFSSCGAGNVADSMVAIRPPQESGDKPEVVYSMRKSAPYVPTPVARGNHLFVVSDGGIATCIDAPTGKEIWKENLRDTYFSSPICVDDRIYAVSRRADVVVFRAADTFELLGRTLINQATNATPIVDNGRMYLRTESHLYCLSGG